MLDRFEEALDKLEDINVHNASDAKLMATLLEDVGIDIDRLVIRKSDRAFGGLFIGLANTKAGWSATVKLNSCSSVWELAIAVRSSNREKYKLFYKSTFNQRWSRGNQLKLTVDTIAKTQALFNIVNDGLKLCACIGADEFESTERYRENAEGFEFVIKLYAKLMSTTFNELPKITSNSDAVKLEFSKVAICVDWRSSKPTLTILRGEQRMDLPVYNRKPAGDAYIDMISAFLINEEIFTHRSDFEYDTHGISTVIRKGHKHVEH